MDARKEGAHGFQGPSRALDEARVLEKPSPDLKRKGLGAIAGRSRCGLPVAPRCPVLRAQGAALTAAEGLQQVGGGKPPRSG